MQIDIEVRPLKKNIGAEIRGVDLSRSLPDQTIKKIREIWVNHVVAVFPNQKVNDEQHIKFSKRLGKLEIINMSALQMKGRPEIYEATNLDDDNNIMLSDHPVMSINHGNQKWHSDSSFKKIALGGVNEKNIKLLKFTTFSGFAGIEMFKKKGPKFL